MRATEGSLDSEQLDYKKTVENCECPELLDRLPRQGEAMPEISSDLAWCICEMPEGDFPRVRVFQDFELMLRRLSALDGQEVAAWVFFGSPLTFTSPDEFGYRYLLTSNSEAHRLPKFAEPVISVPTVKLKNLEVREDGWLGPPELTEGSVESYYLSEGPRDDEFDPEDDIDNEPLEI